jgi:tetratricopeptide (TPR) repeat protein
MKGIQKDKKTTLWEEIKSLYSEGGLFVSTILAFIGLCEATIYICEKSGLDLAFLRPLGKWVLYIILIHGVLFGFIAIYIKRFITSDRNSPKLFPGESENSGGSSILAKDLIGSLKTALAAKHYVEVLRIGFALIRPLFESGSFQARLEIGILVEEAAAAIPDPQAQMVALIDSIGWSCVELGEYERAQGAIMHGYDIAKNLEDHFYISKAKRHLGVICRRQKDYNTAEVRYREALEEVNKIPDSKKKTEAIAGLDYALATLYAHTEKYSEASTAIDSAIKGFEKLGDNYRVPMAQTEKGRICFKAGKINEAKDFFRKALHIAEANGQRLYAVRSHIGLTRIYLSSKDWLRAKESLDAAQELTNDIHCSSEVDEIKALRNDFPQLG